MKTVLFLGDSITDCNHYFDPENLGHGYVRMISDSLQYTAEHKYQILNKGSDGFTVSALRRLWTRSCVNLKPDLVTILIGINDLAVIKNTGITPSVGFARFHEQYQALIDDIRLITDCPILLIEPFIFPYPAEYLSWEPELHTICGIIRQIACDNHLSYLPLWETLRKASAKEGISNITTDGIHLTAKGHKIIAENWFAFYSRQTF